MHSSSPWGDAGFLPVPISTPSGSAISGRLQRPLTPALALLMVSGGSFCSASMLSCPVVEVCLSALFQTSRNHSTNC